jgi:hypothetical protein
MAPLLSNFAARFKKLKTLTTSNPLMKQLNKVIKN